MLGKGIFLSFLSLVFLIAFLPIACGATVLTRVELQKTQEAQRIIFFMKGELPESVSTKHLPYVRVKFSRLGTSSKVNFPSLPFGVITDIKVNKGPKGFIELNVSDLKAHVEYLVLPTIPVKPGMYRLIFDIITSGEIEEAKVLPISEEKKQETEKKEIVEKEIGTSIQEPYPRLPRKGIPFDEYIYLEAEKAFKNKHYNRAWILFNKYIQRADKTYYVDAMYKRAMAFYRLHYEEINKYGFDMIQLFQEALAASSDHRMASEFKCLIGVLYHKLGVTKRAERILEELFNRASSEDTKMCALKEIGRIKLEKELPIEAVPIFFRVLEYEKKSGKPAEELAETYYLLGKTLYASGSYDEAIVNLYKALENSPDVYFEHPDLIRTIGDSLFGLRKYPQARWAFVWYLNLDPNAPHKDMLWAQIAETFYQEHKLRLAERLQNKIILEMPETEGAYVTLLRRAQVLEQKSKGASFQAEMIYEDLANKNLPMPLKEITYFRWALLKRRQGKLTEALNILDRFINTAPDKTPLDDFLELRAQITAEMIIQKFNRNKYSEVIDLYHKYGDDLTLDKTLLEVLTVSFENLGMYDKALRFCEELSQNYDNLDSLWYYRCANYAYMIGNWAKARKYASIVTNPKLEAKKLVILGRVETKLNNCSEAIKLFERLFSIDKKPESDIIFDYLKCLQHIKDHEKIVKFLKKFLKDASYIENSDRFDLLKIQMTSLEKLRRFDDAIRVAEEAVKIAPDEESKCQTIYLMTKLYEKMNRSKEVESCLQQMLSCKNEFWSRFAKQELEFIKFKKKISESIY